MFPAGKVTHQFLWAKTQFSQTLTDMTAEAGEGRKGLLVDGITAADTQSKTNIEFTPQRGYLILDAKQTAVQH